MFGFKDVALEAVYNLASSCFTGTFLRMKAAIFLDQTCRNYLSTQRGSQILEANQFKALCDSVALHLALSVLQ